MKKLPKITFVGLDTNIFIYFFENDVNFGRKAKLIFEKLAGGHLKAVASITSLAELLSSPKLNERAVKETKKLFMSIPNLEIYQLNEIIAIEGAKIRRNYGFRLFDAIQLATAVTSRAKAFITNDSRLKSFKKVKIILLSEIG